MPTGATSTVHAAKTTKQYLDFGYKDGTWPGRRQSRYTPFACFVLPANAQREPTAASLHRAVHGTSYTTGLSPKVVIADKGIQTRLTRTTSGLPGKGIKPVIALTQASPANAWHDGIYTNMKACRPVLGRFQ